MNGFILKKELWLIDYFFWNLIFVSELKWFDINCIINYLDYL